MNPLPFIIAAYGITFLGVIATSLWSWRAVRDAENKADRPRERG